MKAREAALAVIGALVLVASTGACREAADPCAALNKHLKQCGLPESEAQCSGAELAVVHELASRLEDKGCEGAADSESSAIDPRLCALEKWPCPESPPPAPSKAVPQLPVVLVGGIDDSPIFDWSPRIASALRADGIRAFHVSPVPWASTAERAQDLHRSLAAIRARTSDSKLNLVCYAVGGIDCRYLASPGGLFADDPKNLAVVRDTIASITTIATPHRGTRVAEAALAALDNGAANDLLQTIVGGLDPSLHVGIPEHGALATTLAGLTLAASIERNRRLVDLDGIYYQSFAGVSHVLGKSSPASDEAIRKHCVDDEGRLRYFRHPDTRDTMAPLLTASAPFSGTSLDDRGAVVTSPSDGMIAVESAKWGTFRGCIPADHYDVIGQIGTRTRDPMTGFDAPTFYRWVASDLAERGF